MDARGQRQLIAFTDALAAGRAQHFERIVKAPYKAGARREDPLAAIEIGRQADHQPQVLIRPEACSFTQLVRGHRPATRSALAIL